MNIHLTDDEWGDIDILVGADVGGKLLTGNKRTLKCGMVAIETYLGWSLMGKANEESNVYMSNLACLDLTVSDLWRLDVIGVEDPIETRTKEEHELEVRRFEETIHIYEDGRYEVKLPWLESYPPLASNFEMARKRLESTRGKLTSLGLFDHYDKIFKEWLSLGIIEVVSSGEDKNGHFLPHRPVLKESSTTKMRPVFDASACRKGEPSLNRCLEKGPNLIEVIPKILLRFRKERLGVISDIEKAFLQIYIHPDDRKFLKFLWYDECGNLMIFQHRRVVFGVTSSPFMLAAVLQHVIKRAAENYREGKVGYSEKTLNCLKNCFYVDNCVTSFKKEDELQNFVEEATDIVGKAGFRLRGWEYTQPDLLEFTDTPVLGLIWDRKKDTIKLKITDYDVKEDILTRRIILSLTQRIFDVVGIAAPVILVPKLLIQQTWIHGRGWDDPVEDNIKKKFDKWLKDIHYLKDLEIPRWIMASESSVTLHTFCDASKLAYAAVCFLRCEKDGEVQIHFVEAKARVAPVKGCTIPRLELLAALIGVRLTHNIRKELGNIQTFFWSDSSTVIAWIRRSEPWAVFIYNRVKEIRELSNKNEWYHVAGSRNPADLLSRGCSARELVLSRWWEGPDWLRLPDKQWVEEPLEIDEEEVLSERKKSTTMDVCALDETYVSKSLNRFSSYSRMVTVVGWMLRFVNNCRYYSNVRHQRCSSTPPQHIPYLHSSEVEVAEERVLRIVQEEVFHGKEDKRFSKMALLVDQNGLLRLETKILNRIDTEYFKAPIILPSNHCVVEKLILEKHKKEHHIRGQGLLNALREKYWVLRGRQAVRRILKKCTACRRYDAQHFEEDTPALPDGRVRDARVFEVVGVDVAGPLYLRDGTKVWICIFTCAVYRAVHLDIMSSLSTEQLIMILRRFIARRGRPSIVYSDNGTNFRGLYSLLKKIDWEKIARYSSANQIDWRFNPPASPWWGGFWERLIGVLKNLLKRSLGRASLTAEELYTVICECESMINSRPITYVSEIASDPIPITPKMFLHDIEESGVPDLDKINKSTINRRMKYRMRLKEELQKRFRAEYLGVLVLPKRNGKNNRRPTVGEVVLIGSENIKRMDWPLGVIEELIPGKDGKYRVALVRTAEGKYHRPIQRIYPLEVFSEDSTLSDQNPCTEDVDQDHEKKKTRFN